MQFLIALLTSNEEMFTPRKATLCHLTKFLNFDQRDCEIFWGLQTNYLVHKKWIYKRRHLGKFSAQVRRHKIILFSQKFLYNHS